VTPRELLEQAIALARMEDPDPLACQWCGMDRVHAVDRPGLGPIPCDPHWAQTMATACLALRGEPYARIRHEALWAALDPFLDLAPAGYGDDTELAVVNEELALL